MSALGQRANRLGHGGTRSRSGADGSAGTEGVAPVTIRRIVPADLAALIALCQAHAAYERAEYVVDGKQAALQRALFDTPARLTVWVAQQHGVLVGYVAVTAEFATWEAREFLHMDALFVREAARGDGVGAALLAVVVDHAREQGLAQIQWQTPQWNVRAAKFYRREGAIETFKRRFSLSC